MQQKEWIDSAAQFFANYAVNKACMHTFLAEEVREYASRQGFPEPHDPRAWGLAAKQAMRQGAVTTVGFASAKSSNGSPKALWRART